MAETPESTEKTVDQAQTAKTARQDEPGSTLATPPATQVPPKIGPWYPPSWARQPPGMPWDDWAAWQPFMQGPGAAWPEYAYNVRLAVGDPDEPPANVAALEMWRELTAKRIDALGRRGNRYTIFEARRISGWSAIAQLLGYRTLWQLNYPDLDLDTPWLITTAADTALRLLAAQNGIKIWTVGDPPA